MSLEQEEGSGCLKFILENPLLQSGPCELGRSHPFHGSPNASWASVVKCPEPYVLSLPLSLSFTLKQQALVTECSDLRPEEAV